MKSIKHILITCLFILGYAFTSQAMADQVSTSPTMSEEELVAQEATDQTECGNWSWS